LNVEEILARVRFRKTRWQRKQRSPGTLRVYSSIYSRYNSFPGEDNAEKAAKFLTTLGDNDSYRRTCYYALKSAFWAMKLPWFDQEDDPLPPPSENISRPFYTGEEMEKIMEAAKPSLRDFLIIRITFLSGARRIQICKCRISDYDRRRGTLNIPGAKNTPAGEWLCDPSTKPLLDKWVGIQGDHSNFLFPSRGGDKMMDPGTVTRIFQRYCECAAVEYRENGMKRGKGAHGARRGRVTYLKNLGYDVDDITKALRWKSPFTVHTYVRTLPSEVNQDIARNDPFYLLDSVSKEQGEERNRPKSLNRGSR
jgi:integrase